MEIKKAVLFQTHDEIPNFSLFFSVEKVLEGGLLTAVRDWSRRKSESSSLGVGKLFGRISGAP